MGFNPVYGNNRIVRYTHIMWSNGCGLSAQEDVVKLQTENSDLRHSEQSLSLRVQYLEAEQQQQVEVALRLRNDVDRYRQELAQYDTDKRGMSRQMSEKEVEMAQLRQQVRELQEQLETESKTKDRKL